MCLLCVFFPIKTMHWLLTNTFIDFVYFFSTRLRIINLHIPLHYRQTEAKGKKIWVTIIRLLWIDTFYFASSFDLSIKSQQRLRNGIEENQWMKKHFSLTVQHKRWTKSIARVSTEKKLWAFMTLIFRTLPSHCRMTQHHLLGRQH